MQRNLWRLLASTISLWLGLSATAWAGQSGELVCVQWVWGGESGNVCGTYELRVHITTDGDVGRPGAFGIGAQLASGQMAYWTVAGGWQAPTKGESLPVDGYYQALPPSRDYVVYHGTLAGMCAYGGGLTIGAGHGALTPEREAQIEQLASHPGVKVPIDHFRDAFIRMDVQKNNKWGTVYNGGDCITGSNAAGG